jgi:hypothetical protein
MGYAEHHFLVHWESNEETLGMVYNRWIERAVAIRDNESQSELTKNPRSRARQTGTWFEGAVLMLVEKSFDTSEVVINYGERPDYLALAGIKR